MVQLFSFFRCRFKRLINHEAIAAAKAGIEGFVRSVLQLTQRQFKSKRYCPKHYGFKYVAKDFSSEVAIEVSKNMHPISKTGDAGDILPVVKRLLSDDAMGNWTNNTCRWRIVYSKT